MSTHPQILVYPASLIHRTYIQHGPRLQDPHLCLCHVRNRIRIFAMQRNVRKLALLMSLGLFGPAACSTSGLLSSGVSRGPASSQGTPRSPAFPLPLVTPGIPTLAFLDPSCSRNLLDLPHTHTVRHHSLTPSPHSPPPLPGTLLNRVSLLEARSTPHQTYPQSCTHPEPKSSIS